MENNTMTNIEIKLRKEIQKEERNLMKKFNEENTQAIIDHIKDHQIHQSGVKTYPLYYLKSIGLDITDLDDTKIYDELGFLYMPSDKEFYRVREVI